MKEFLQNRVFSCFGLEFKICNDPIIIALDSKFTDMNINNIYTYPDTLVISVKDIDSDCVVYMLYNSSYKDNKYLLLYVMELNEYGEEIVCLYNRLYKFIKKYLCSYLKINYIVTNYNHNLYNYCLYKFSNLSVDFIGNNELYINLGYDVSSIERMNKDFSTVPICRLYNFLNIVLTIFNNDSGDRCSSLCVLDDRNNIVVSYDVGSNKLKVNNLSKDFLYYKETLELASIISEYFNNFLYGTRSYTLTRRIFKDYYWLIKIFSLPYFFKDIDVKFLEELTINLEHMIISPRCRCFKELGVFK